MTADLIETARKMLDDAAEIASERREKASESHMTAMMIRNSRGNDAITTASGFDMAAEYALKTARILDQFPALLDTITAIQARAEAAEAKLARMETAPFPDETGFYGLIGDGLREAEKAMRKFPQPNYVISKVAEEAGEVVKAAIHCAEGRETTENLRGEMKQLIAMLYRLWVEGDGVHGLLPCSRRPTQAPHVSIQTQTAPPQITAGMIHQPVNLAG